MMLDCIIVGAGPAGLTAAIYLARFHLKVAVIDAGHSRALWIPETHNHAGFPGGISGAALLNRMRQQAELFNAVIWNARVSDISLKDKAFIATYGDAQATATTVLLATGVVNRRPTMDNDLHEKALNAGRLRYCPICDGYEVTDQHVAVIGTGNRGLAEAEFLRSYTKKITLISPEESHELDQDQREKARRLKIKLVEGAAAIDRITDAGIVVATGDGEVEFEAVYPALGSDVNNALAKMLGAKCGEDDGISVDPEQRTSVAGLYAAGDVVIGLDQISHAMGEGGVAAVTIRNDLAQRHALLR